jgi:hypothetical protein
MITAGAAPGKCEWGGGLAGQIRRPIRDNL